MAFRRNRWFKRWLLVIAVWAVPVMIMVAREFREEMAYNTAELDRALTTWTFASAAGAPSRCHGNPDQAKAAGCPVEVLAANATRQQEALDEYALRKSTLANHMWQVFVDYWGVPAAFLFAVGLMTAGLRRALRRPSAAKNPVSR